MNREQIFTDLQEIIVDKMGLEPDEITTESEFFNDLGFDSLDAIEVLMEVEKKYDIGILDSDADKLITVENAVDYLFERLN